MKKLSDYASGNFIKPLNVSSEKDQFEVTSAEETKANDGREVLRLTLVNGTNEFDFDVNKTNASFLVGKGFDDPLSLVGKKLCFKKALVRNPKTNVEVEGLRICNVI